MDINSITKSIAKQYGGDLLGLKAKEEKAKNEQLEREAEEFERRVTKEASSGYSTSYSSGTKIWPSEKFDLKTTASAVFVPRRPPVMISTYSDDDLEWMFSTPVKRGWEFKDWLEVIGLPTDLHDKHDGAMYQYAARAYLNRKREAHSR